MICMIRGCKGRESFLETEISKLDAEVKALHDDAEVQEDQCIALSKANNAKVDEMSARHLAYVAWAEAEIDKMDGVITKLRDELSVTVKYQMSKTFHDTVSNTTEALPDVGHFDGDGNRLPSCVQTEDGDLVCTPDTN